MNEETEPIGPATTMLTQAFTASWRRREILWQHAFPAATDAQLLQMAELAYLSYKEALFGVLFTLEGFKDALWEENPSAYAEVFGDRKPASGPPSKAV